MNEDCSAMEAGEKLDELVAVQVMGWTKRPSHDIAGGALPGWFSWYDGGGKYWGSDKGPVAEFSTNIESAWQVAQKLRECGIGLVIGPALEFDRGWCVTDGNYNPIASAPTAPLAICRASLKAVAALALLAATRETQPSAPGPRSEGEGR